LGGVAGQGTALGFSKALLGYHLSCISLTTSTPGGCETFVGPLEDTLQMCNKWSALFEREKVDGLFWLKPFT
jgi:hypothetical protein